MYEMYLRIIACEERRELGHHNQGANPHHDHATAVRTARAAPTP